MLLARFMRTAIALVLLVVSSPALAEPKVAAGISAGLFQNKEDAAAGIDSTQTLGLWGRAGLSKRVSEIVQPSSSARLQSTRTGRFGCARATSAASSATSSAPLWP